MSSNFKRCQYCKGASFEWSCHSINRGIGVIDGRIRMSEIDVVFIVKCVGCLRTLLHVDGDKIASYLNKVKIDQVVATI